MLSLKTEAAYAQLCCILFFNKIRVSLVQWFSTFFNSRHTEVQKNFGGTLIPLKIANLTKKGFFSKKRIGKVRKKNLAAHLEGAH
jgi:hypothetical protein